MISCKDCEGSPYCSCHNLDLRPRFVELSARKTCFVGNHLLVNQASLVYGHKVGRYEMSHEVKACKLKLVLGSNSVAAPAKENMHQLDVAAAASFASPSGS